MSNFTVQYFNCEKPAKPFSFYVLCKGLNSGKPLQAPCPNCFVFTCSSEAEKDFYQTICFALWKAKTFHPHLCGSVILFLRVAEFKKIVTLQAAVLQECDLQFLQVVEQVKSIEVKEGSIKQQLALLGQLKIAMLRQFIK